MVKISEANANLNAWPDLKLDPGQVAIWWLGQAGFLFRSNQHSLIIDPYLSDSLAIKYGDKEFKHIRMMPIPVQPGEIAGINWIFATHQHGDHMDIGTLPALVGNNPGCRFFAPRSAAAHVFESIRIDRGVTTGLDAGDNVELSSRVSVDVIASAHEQLQFDDQGNAMFLGLIFSINGMRIYHSGDCTPYEGQAARLRDFNVDIAMLPVNGRDGYRRSRGILGNFHFEEAVALCADAGIEHLIAHHFGMFEFNTVDPVDIRRKAGRLEGNLNVILPEIDTALIVETDR